jgi:signal transduction histidine kinase
VQSAISQVIHSARSKDISIETDFSPEVPLIAGDAEKLRRVLVNLLSNAVKFTRPDGQIAVSVRHHAEGVLFSVRDSGKGISPENFELIFEKFSQAERRQSGDRASTGLGLTFCKMVVEAHGGRIWVESELEKGSEFLFIIPAK